MLFADISALFAFLVADDRLHGNAVRAEAGVRARRESIWTIDSVLTELWLLLRRETSRELSDGLVSGLLERGLRREPPRPEDYLRAWELARDWPDQDFSLTDRQSFAAVERSRRLRAWSYDADIAVIRLGRQRRVALDLVPSVARPGAVSPPLLGARFNTHDSAGALVLVPAWPRHQRSSTA